MMFVSGVLRRRDRRVERGGLAAARRAGDEHMPYGLAMAARSRSSDLASKPSFVMSSISLSRVEEPEDDLLAEERGQARDAEVDVLGHPLSLNSILMRPSCGSRFSEMSSFAMILMREMMASLHLHRRRHDVVAACRRCETGSGTPSRTARYGCRSRPSRWRHQHDVDQLDDGRLFALSGQQFGADLFVLLQDLHVAAVDLRHLLERPRRQLQGVAAGPRRRLQVVVLLDRLAEGRLRRHDRFDVVARHELDVVHGEHVGRIGHRDGQRRARSAEGDELILLRGVGGNQLDDRGIDLELPDDDDGTPYCRLRIAVMSSSRTNPSFTRLRPSFPPCAFWC